MTLHIFNPEHDIALAADELHFTAPHAARELRTDLGFLPALWADDGDLILVEKVSAAVNSVRHLKCHTADVLFVTPADLSVVSFSDITIDPWGWDRVLKAQLRTINPELERLTPSDEQLTQMRRLSNRRWAGEQLLPQLVGIDDRLIGTSEYITDIQTVEMQARQLRRSVFKAPWSSSGRGLRYVDAPTDE